MALERAQVIKGVGSVEPTRMDQAHEEITHASSVLRFVTEGVFSVEDRHLQCPHFGDDTGGKDSRPLRSRLFLFEALDPHRGVIIVQKLAAGSHGEEFLVHGLQIPGGSLSSTLHIRTVNPSGQIMLFLLMLTLGHSDPQLFSDN